MSEIDILRDLVCTKRWVALNVAPAAPSVTVD